MPEPAATGGADKQDPPGTPAPAARCLRVQSPPAPGEWPPQPPLLCPQGLRKRDLLKELLPVIGQNLRFQRLFTECQEQLDLLRDK